MCSGSEAGSHLGLIDFVYHSTSGLRVIKTKTTGGVHTSELMAESSAKVQGYLAYTKPTPLWDPTVEICLGPCESLAKVQGYLAHKEQRPPLGPPNVWPHFTEKCSSSEAGSHLRLIGFLYHSTLGLRARKRNMNCGGKTSELMDGSLAKVRGYLAHKKQPPT